MRPPTWNIRRCGTAICWDKFVRENILNRYVLVCANVRECIKTEWQIGWINEKTKCSQKVNKFIGLLEAYFILILARKKLFRQSARDFTFLIWYWKIPGNEKLINETKVFICGTEVQSFNEISIEKLHLSFCRWCHKNWQLKID